MITNFKIFESKFDDIRREIEIENRIKNIRSGNDRNIYNYEWSDQVGWGLPSFEEYCGDRDFDPNSDSSWEQYIWYCEDAYEDIKNNR